MIKRNNLMAGCQDDDRRSGDFRCLLATIPHLFHRLVALSESQSVTLHTGTLFGQLLVGYVQFHVQPHHLLLDEFKVFTSYFTIFFKRENLKYTVDKRALAYRIAYHSAL